MLDYGITFLNTPVYIDNNSAISIVNNPVKHSKTKHIEIKYHFIQDSNEKKLIQVLKVHTDYQYADLFTKAFDVGRFKFLITMLIIAKRSLLLLSKDDLRFHEEHNKVGFLTKGKKSEGFNDIVDFLRSSTLAHAILLDPKIYIDHQRDFWRNAHVEMENSMKTIHTTIQNRPLSVTESTIRRKTSGWSEFGSIIASALVSLATSKRFNFSNMIFENLVSNLDPKSTSTAFYMYPRFIQEVINMELTDVPTSSQTYNMNDPSFKM
ncbi:hypothetical protein OSB04_029492 [Centaurea solstitialis]|uniref:Uncharacterized protein n=1 Tax=Centaurea solstitialis TaxID=347529 RepID=A0AA38SW31_9ASTR|nr:hypothetical protein OSB04_029492 [Centaurea solstitialis]